MSCQQPITPLSANSGNKTPFSLGKRSVRSQSTQDSIDPGLAEFEQIRKCLKTDSSFAPPQKGTPTKASRRDRILEDDTPILTNFSLKPETYTDRSILTELNKKLNERIARQFGRFEESFTKLRNAVGKILSSDEESAKSESKFMDNDWSKEERERKLLEIAKLLDEASLKSTSSKEPKKSRKAIRREIRRAKMVRSADDIALSSSSKSNEFNMFNPLKTEKNNFLDETAKPFLQQIKALLNNHQSPMKDDFLSGEDHYQINMNMKANGPKHFSDVDFEDDSQQNLFGEFAQNLLPSSQESIPVSRESGDYGKKYGIDGDYWKSLKQNQECWEENGWITRPRNYGIDDIGISHNGTPDLSEVNENGYFD